MNENLIDRAVGAATPDIFIREQVNLMAVVLFSCVVMICLWWVWSYRRKNPNDWYRVPSVQGATALVCLGGGEAMARLWAWILLRTTRVSGSAMALQLEAGFPLALIGGFFIFAGGLCVIRVFTPIEWGPWPWLSAASVTIVALVWNWWV